VKVSGIDVDYSAEGPTDAPVVVLAGSLGSTRAMWRPQVEALSRDFRVVAYDHRGHGTSPVPEGPYGIDGLGADVLRLLDRIGAQRVHFAGLSLGGMTGMWLAAHAPQRIDRLALLCTSALLGPPGNWAQRARTVLAEGAQAVADGVVQRWFTPGFAEREPEEVARFRAMIAATPASGYAGCCRAIEGMDLRSDLRRILAPTLAIAGTDDPATPPEHLQAIVDELKSGELHEVPGAHLASWESADQVTALLREHFGG
jgi:3-oxoadipate enol-lactonase